MSHYMDDILQLYREALTLDEEQKERFINTLGSLLTNVHGAMKEFNAKSDQMDNQYNQIAGLIAQVSEQVEEYMHELRNSRIRYINMLKVFGVKDPEQYV